MKNYYKLLGMVFCIMAFTAGGNAGSTPADLQSTESSILATLRAGHPRIIALDEDIRATSYLLQTDPRGPGWLQALRASAEEIIRQPPVEHKLDGPRLLTQSRTALNRIMLLGFLYRLEPESRYLNRAVLEMETASAFPDWNPSHFLDTAEMTTAMAIGYDWFYADLTTDTRSKVREGIIKLGLEEGIKIYQQKPRWVNGHNNWNQVCNGGLIIGALAIADEEPRISSRILRKGKDSLSRGMLLFEPDGGWVEAPMYWLYTMKYTSQVLSAMHTALGTAFGLDEGPGFKKTGDFILAMEGPGKQFFNWGDCSEMAGNLPEMFWLARRFDNPVYATVADNHLQGTPSVMDLLYYEPSSAGTMDDVPLDWYFRDTEVASFRQAWNDPSASFGAFKGGDNNAPHSNLDLGTFVFDADGERWAIELGGDNYNLPGYWNKDKRLAYYRINSFGQNVLTMNNSHQDLTARSVIHRRGSNGDSAYGIAGLTEAYTPFASRVQRGLALMGQRRHLVIQDEFETTGAVDLAWAMHTKAKAEIRDNTILLSQGKSTATLKLIEPADGKLFVESAEQNPPQRKNNGVLRVGVRHRHPMGQGRVIVQISPGSATEFSYKVRDLENWK